jgi:paraquat-inducible protein A
MTIACTDCGTLQDIPPLPWGAIAICPTCDNRLERTNGRSINGALACASATFIVLFPANLLPIMRVSMLGMARESRLGSGVVTLWQHQWVLVAVLVAAFAVILPFVRFGLLSLVLTLLQLGRRPHWLGRAFRWSLHLDQWAMPDVYLIGCAVGYSRIAAVMPVSIGWGGICLIFAAFLCMLSRAALDTRAVWRVLSPECAAPPEDQPTIACRFCDLVRPATAEGTRCPRCGLTLSTRQYAQIPAAAAGGLESLPAEISSLPLTQIADNLRTITDQVRSLTSSPQLRDSIARLDATLATLQRISRQAGPQVAPTLRDVRATAASLRTAARQLDATAQSARLAMGTSPAAPSGNLQHALDELAGAARAVRSLADYLDEHPGALLRGRKAQAPR